MRVHVLFLLLCVAPSIAASSDKASSSAMQLQLLANGTTPELTYSLYRVESKERDTDLLLLIRNTGAKHIDFDKLQKEHFELTDSKGQPKKIFSVTGATGVSYRGLMTLHIVVQGTLKKDSAYTLEMEEIEGAFVPTKFKTKSFKVTNTKGAANQ